MRLVYTLFWWLALPLVLARLWWRGRREPGYRAHVGERLACYGPRLPKDRTAEPLIWVHAVSVGETRAAEPLVRALLAEFPQHRILLTHMTPTGRATGQALFADVADRVRQCYLPYDIGPLVSRFIDRFQPRICILMETEVWPNVIAQCARWFVPVVLANARLSERSLKKGKRLQGLLGTAARQIEVTGAQTEADAERIVELGGRNVHVTGSIKFDIVPPEAMLERGAQLRRRIGNRPVLSCAITREGEEALILDALPAADLGDALLLIVPRHPQRFDEVAALVAARGMKLVRRSVLGDAPVPADAQVLLGDTMGEMFAYHAASDVVFIGGSLLPLGGHNLIEACAVGKPVLIGPHTFNFAAVTDDAVEAGAALRVAGPEAMLQQAERLLLDELSRRKMGNKALAFAQQHRGATQRTMGLLRALIR